MPAILEEEQLKDLLVTYYQNIFGARFCSNLFDKQSSIIELKNERDRLASFERSGIKPDTKLKSDNESLISITQKILNKLKNSRVNERLGKRHRESEFKLEYTSGRKNKQRNAIKEIDRKSLWIIESLNKIKLERLRELISSDRNYSPVKICGLLENFISELSQMLVDFFTNKEMKPKKKAFTFKKVMSLEELKVAPNNHFKVRRDKFVRYTRSAELCREKVCEENVQELISLVNSTQVKQSNGRVAKLDRFSNNLVRHLKLNLERRLTNSENECDMVVKVRSVFRERNSVQSPLVQGILFACFFRIYSDW